MRYAIGFASICVCALAQQPLKFEVASVKLRPPNSLITMVGGRPSGSRLTFEAMSLSDLVSFAYNIKPWQVTGGPSWAGIQKDKTTLDTTAKRFDITAKAEGEAARPTEEFRQMLQALLADRFQLSLHREQRDTAVYALVRDKKGPKFSESGPDAKGVLIMNGGGAITASGGTMPQFAGWLSNTNGVDRPVVDQTDLTGRYDFKVEWSNPLATTQESTAPSIFAALPEQLGLRLEPRRAPVEFFVIDRAEVPGEN